MRRKGKNRIIIAWALLLALMPIYIVKAVHYHDVKDATACHSAAAGNSQSSDTCPICHFFLSPFVEAPAVHVCFYASVVVVSTVAAVVRPVTADIRVVSLRAPPSQF